MLHYKPQPAGLENPGEKDHKTPGELENPGEMVMSKPLSKFRRLLYCRPHDNKFLFLTLSNNVMAAVKIDWICDREVANGSCSHSVRQPP